MPAESSRYRPLLLVGLLGAAAAYLFAPASVSRQSIVRAAAPPATAVASAVAPATKPAGKIIFNRDIRPILADRCFACHGFDPAKRQSGFRLDLEASAFGPLPKHADKKAFVPGRPDLSYAYQRMITTDKAEMMPPATSHLRLNDHERELVRQWIVEGAQWQEHWGFVKPVRPAVPEVKDGSWPRNEIDHFILAKLEREGLKPSPEADRATLIRRVSLDLTGIPPTPAEVDAFVADSSSGAYENLVDRLLASPRYGEQMAVAWLDTARYADSHGYQSDPERHMWHWRDWVIKAFNDNMPFDQFAIEQIAGDLLPNATESQKIATGFNRNHRMNSEGGIIDEEWRVETVVDRVETTSGTFLGLTMGCCRCHDHKYDPITQKEFYEFSAYFNSIAERGEYFSVGLDKGINGAPTMKVFSEETKSKLATLRGAMAAEEAKLAALQARLPEFEQKYKDEGIKTPDPDGLALRFTLDGTADGATGPGASAKPVTKADAADDDADAEPKAQPAPATTQVAAAATGPTTTATVATKAKPAQRKTVIPVAATRPDHPVTVAATFEAKDGTNYADGKLGKGIKFDGKGTAAVDAGQAIAFDRLDSFSYGAWVNIQGPDGCVLSKMDKAPGHRGIDILVTGGKVAAHIISNWSSDAIKVTTASPVPMNAWTHVMVTYDGSSKASGVTVYVDGVPQQTVTDVDNLRRTIRSKSPLLIGKRVDGSFFNGSVDDVRFYSRKLTRDEVTRLAVGPDLQQLVQIEADKRTPEQKAKLSAALLAPLPEYGDTVKARDAAKAEIDKIDGDPANSTMVMEDLPKPRDTFILNRGQYDQHGEKVEHGVPAILNKLPADAPKNRLALAKWIVAEDNPLTARVQANRLWEKFFGVGIVKTSENFGTQAEWPSHPELLDWLGTELVRLKWDLKALQREIVLSAAYRQSSNMTPEMIERDPENRLVARGPRLRLPAETVRDQALAFSGLLVEKLGGPSVKPYQPKDLWAGNLFGNLVEYKEDKGDSLYRRSMYTFVKRTALPANMMVWDMASREYCVVKRSRTNTPLQALNTMNDVTFVEASRVLAEHMMTDGGKTVPERVAYAFKRATCRPPTEEESKILAEQFERQLERYKAKPEAAKKLIALGAAKANDKLDPTELAAYTMTANVILNLDEVITKP